MKREVKEFEILDRATFIPSLGISVEGDTWLSRRSGYGSRCILLTRLGGGSACCYDPYEWVGARTMRVAHQYIEENWDQLESGEVIDVEFILGETDEKKESEKLEYYQAVSQMSMEKEHQPTRDPELHP
jgi:hypothetical protein